LSAVARRPLPGPSQPAHPSQPIPASPAQRGQQDPARFYRMTLIGTSLRKGRLNLLFSARYCAVQGLVRVSGSSHFGRWIRER
jgi:hypothetical protein